MNLIIIVIGVLTLVAAVFVVPEFRNKLRLNTHAKFVGEISHYDDSKPVIRFLTKNVGKIVWLDSYINANSFRGNISDDYAWFSLYDNLDKKKNADTQQKQSGWEISFQLHSGLADSSVYYERGLYKIHGFFAVICCAGPYQGFMVISLRAVSITDAS